jgi:MarR family transcriptional regulator, organic hydroperoxide resistance regulator
MADERPERQLLHLLSHTQHRVTTRVGAALRKQRSSLEEWRVLSLLADGRGHSMSEIAEFALTPAPTMTKVIDRMVANNLVYRRVDPADRRRVLVFLSARGRAAHRRLRPVVEASIDCLDDDVPLRDLVRELQRRVGPELETDLPG